MRTLLFANAIVLTASLALAQERTAEPPYQRAELLSGIGPVRFAVTTDLPLARQFFDQGIALLHGGWEFEAERSFRQVAHLDPQCAMAWWGMAVAAERVPKRAAEWIGEAERRQDSLESRERGLVLAYGRFLGAGAGEGSVWARRLRLQADLAALVAMAPDDIEVRAFLVRELVRGALAGAEPTDVARERAVAAADAFGRAAGRRHPGRRYRLLLAALEPPELQPIERARARAQQTPAISSMWHAGGAVLARAGRPTEAGFLHDAAVRADHAFLAATNGMPYEVRGYLDRALAATRSLAAAHRHDDAVGLLRQLVEAPRHPRLGHAMVERAVWRGVLEALSGGMNLSAPDRDVLVGIAAALGLDDDWRDSNDDVLLPLEGYPKPEAIGPRAWSPPAAPGLRLPLGTGGECALSDYAGKPVLVVFFLGFGCVHCVDQLNSLGPRAGDFAAAGIPIVTVGTDTVAQVKASFQQAIEADDDPLPFPVACDPDGDTFKDWRCWDEFGDEALHGTFLIDADGKIRWQDISIEPFMATDFLLDECRRLLAQPTRER